MPRVFRIGTGRHDESNGTNGNHPSTVCTQDDESKISKNNLAIEDALSVLASVGSLEERSAPPHTSDPPTQTPLNQDYIKEQAADISGHVAQTQDPTTASHTLDSASSSPTKTPGFSFNWSYAGPSTYIALKKQTGSLKGRNRLR